MTGRINIDFREHLSPGRNQGLKIFKAEAIKPLRVIGNPSLF